VTLRISSGGDVMLALGDFQFGLNTAAFQEFSRSTEQRWSAQDVFGQLAALQHTGPGQETITLPGVILPEFRGSAGQIDRLRALAADAVPVPLITGTGRILGEYVIERVEERQSVFAAAGLARKIEFTVTLRLYDDGSAPGGANAAIVSRLASVALPSSTGPFTSVTQARSTIGNFGTNVAGVIGGARTSLASAIGGVTGAPSLVAQVNGALSSANRLIAAAQGLGQVGSAATALAGLQGLQSQAGVVAGVAAAVSRTAGGLTGPGFTGVQTAAARMATEAARANALAAQLQGRLDPWPST
jgi:phage protein U